MEVIPAIDLKDGRCVRLYQGDFEQEMVFSRDPQEVALGWQGEGAGRLHIVDLDGAQMGMLSNRDAIERILSAVVIPVQLGGGIRRMETIEELTRLGVDRVILGTAAIEDEALVREACLRFGEGIIVSIDARDGYVSTHGWKEKTDITASGLIESMASLGVKRFIYTDILRDGTLTEPNFEEIARLVSKTSLPIIASGGISSIEQLKRLSKLGVEGAIVGRALYTGDVVLGEAVATLQ